MNKNNILLILITKINICLHIYGTPLRQIQQIGQIGQIGQKFKGQKFTIGQKNTIIHKPLYSFQSNKNIINNKDILSAETVDKIFYLHKTSKEKINLPFEDAKKLFNESYFTNGRIYKDFIEKPHKGFIQGLNEEHKGGIFWSINKENYTKEQREELNKLASELNYIL